ncbi:DUF6297 family protein [Nonomuraea sp. NPDC059194]|uniref:DUF6297 family protein n=1 Tax=Nonomuraea sp. NPDC059194 TaxID=3346764 RepID=UPI00369C2777
MRAFVRSRGRAPASLLDRYVALFALAVAAAVAGNPVSSALAGLAGRVEVAQVGPGVALVVLAYAGFVAAARAAGPVVVTAADAAWLLLSPLDRPGVLGRTGRVLLLVSVVVGAGLGLGLLAVLGAPDQLVWRLMAALVLGVSASVGGMALAVLGQASQSWHAWVTAGLVALLVVAVVAASGQARGVLAAVAAAPLPAVTATASAVALTSTLLIRRAWTALARIPSRTILAASTRAGHVTTATVTLDPGALTWIAEDNHWRARSLRSRPWPSLPWPFFSAGSPSPAWLRIARGPGRLAGPFALAWQDWVRAARRPGRLAAMLATAALPAVLAGAGGAPAAVGASVLAGALAMAAGATSGARRDADNPSLARLAGVGHPQALAARALLPALLSGVWTATALTGLSLAGWLPAGAWWLFGPLAAPAIAAAALRMARRGPVDHSMPVIDTPGGAIPTGPLIWALIGVDLAVLGSLPAVVALVSQPHAIGGFLAAQAALGAAVLVGYVHRSRVA